MLAALNHPGIAQIHGFEDSDGVHALAMELVAGEDLSQRIAGRSIPLDEALPIARQIADALEAAHEQGIIHRDLKPANIKVGVDGSVKILDFGLAKALDDVPAGQNVTHSPTLSLGATRQGVILGTAGYMAPEQSSRDSGTDVWVDQPRTGAAPEVDERRQEPSECVVTRRHQDRLLRHSRGSRRPGFVRGPLKQADSRSACLTVRGSSIRRPGRRTASCLRTRRGRAGLRGATFGCCRQGPQRGPF